MKISNAHYSLELCDRTGKIISYADARGNEYTCTYDKIPLVTMRLKDSGGGRVEYTSDFLADMKAERLDDRVILHYSNFGGGMADVTATVAFDDSPFVRWTLDYENKTAQDVEWINYPGLTLGNKTAEFGGKHKLFLPIFEGVEISDYAMRNNVCKYMEPDYPSKGWEGVYPGSVSLQFMAYYDQTGGLYVGAHDPGFNTKGIDVAELWNGLRFDTKFFPGVTEKKFDYGFDYVTGFFNGDFYDAADIYRDFADNCGLTDIPKLRENPLAADWLQKSPVVTVYPVCGEKDTGDMSPNCYYPYTNALPYLDKLRDRVSVPLLVLLCQWEGTAPWCPPFVWPPYGDGNDFKTFVKTLRERGNLFGLYCSGTAWTEKSIFTDYNREGYFTQQQLKDTMCTAPDGSLPYCIICNDYIRWGYDMCPACKTTQKIMRDEAKKMAGGCEVDYIQLFDQNLGGNAAFCYADHHGHPSVPGRWQTDAMRGLIDSVQQVLDEERGVGNVIVGCEAAAAEGLLDKLVMNDARNFKGYLAGRPVPAYNYVYHEYVCNFMGNQNTFYYWIDHPSNPENVFYRTAQFFAQGDLLTVVLKDDGKINWDWGTPWDEADPDQEKYLRFLKTLCDWRTGALRDALFCGRMKKPHPVECGAYTIWYKDGKKADFPSVIATRFVCDGEDVSVFVNYADNPQTFSLSGVNLPVELLRSADGKAERYAAAERLTLEIAPLSVIKMTERK